MKIPTPEESVVFQDEINQRVIHVVVSKPEEVFEIHHFYDLFNRDPFKEWIL